MRKITIECVDKCEKGKVLGLIHDQLKGNQDYIDSNIVLCDLDDCLDQHIVTIFVADEVKEMPKIIL